MRGLTGTPTVRTTISTEGSLITSRKKGNLGHYDIGNFFGSGRTGSCSEGFILDFLSILSEFCPFAPHFITHKTFRSFPPIIIINKYPRLAVEFSFR